MSLCSVLLQPVAIKKFSSSKLMILLIFIIINNNNNNNDVLLFDLSVVIIAVITPPTSLSPSPYVTCTRITCPIMYRHNLSQLLSLDETENGLNYFQLRCWRQRQMLPLRRGYQELGKRRWPDWRTCKILSKLWPCVVGERSKVRGRCNTGPSTPEHQSSQ